MDSFLKKFIPPDLIDKFKKEYEKWITAWNEKSQLDRREHEELIALAAEMKNELQEMKKMLGDKNEKV